MAKYTVIHSCGHEETVQLYGREGERKNRIEWLEGTLCRECENTQSLAKVKGIDLPDLEGSAKQVKWANSIRAEATAALLEKGEMDAYAQTLKKTRADWWIDNRGNLRDAIYADKATEAALVVIDKAIAVAESAPFNLTVEKKTVGGTTYGSAVASTDIDTNALSEAIEAAIKDDWNKGSNSQNPSRYREVFRYAVNEGITPLLNPRKLPEETPIKDAAEEGAASLSKTSVSKKAPEWRRVLVNAQNIEVYSGSSVCINMPKSSEYKGYSFWVSQKLFRDTVNAWLKALSFKDDFMFDLKRYAPSQRDKDGRRTVLHETSVPASVMLEAFEPTTATYSAYLKDQSAEYSIDVEPDAIEIADVEVPPCLKN